MRTLTIEVDECDYDEIVSAIARRQAFRCLPDVDAGCLSGRLLAEIRRGWIESLDLDDDDYTDGESWKYGDEH